MTLAGQFLVLQLLIVLLVVATVGGLSFAQTGRQLERAETRRALSAAENLAGNPTVRALLPTALPGGSSPLAAVGETVRSVSGSTTVALLRPDRTVLASSVPDQVGATLRHDGPRAGIGSWTGAVAANAVAAEVPVLDESGRHVGTARVGRELPSVADRLAVAGPDLLAYGGLATTIGVLGSTMLSRRIKRQTLGLEPTEIAGLVEHREALLHGIKEGVLALDTAGRVTLLNDSARLLLALPPDAVGRPLEELTQDAELREVLTAAATPDRLVAVGTRLLVLNRMPVRSHGAVIGSVTTMRDQTELQAMERALDTSRRTTGTLRAQTHEFSNQLHTISGLLQLEQYDEAVRFVEGVSHHRENVYAQVTERVADPPLAALLIAKDSLAAERGSRLVLAVESQVSRVDEPLSRDLITVVGNLVDNALDAVAGTPEPRIEIALSEDAEAVTVRVSDCGAGVDVADAERLFRSGFSTKDSDEPAGRGYGLALVRLVCRRRGGDVTVHNDGGAVFTARLRKTAAEVAA
ncbi:GHKL domain-containing protein [Georgenia thermotolerans]|uniref:Sensor-like histidine kinase SenX3 n=2 Tax=Georgenia thermotolerans TaxID=527326 RepID=A0A7J5UT17_9MICO|nr:sensor histidine kinase [Georgenia thermotolerans]KAE8765344.1 GHKL domain-containing protein [Georgenia thermotolerans]